MSYCINPKCSNRENRSNLNNYCQACGTQLLINNRYRLVKPLRQISPQHSTEIFEVDEQGKVKVIKILKKNRLKLIELFQQEAYILTHLKHSGIPQAEPNESFTFLLSNGQELHCLVMEKIRGYNLEQLLNENYNEPISQDLAIDWIRQIAKILFYLHQNKFFHRDIKPSNIIQKPNNKLVLIDFGTAREITETVVNGKTVTAVYSHGYTAPEQLEGRAIPQSDFFALGRTFIHLLTGKHPTCFASDLQKGKLMWRDSAPQICDQLADLIDDLMAISMAMRPENAQNILHRIEQIMLHITLERLKEIESLSPILLCQQEKLENASLTIPVLAKTEFSFSGFSPEYYQRFQEITREFIGPIASTFLQQFAGQVHSPKELVNHVLLFLTPGEQVEFTKKVMFLMQEIGEHSIKSTNSSHAKNQVITESFVHQCEQELADLIGPIANFIVQKTLTNYLQISPKELVKALAAHIPEPQKANEFQQRLVSDIEQN